MIDNIFSDKPITSIEEDKLERSKFADNIATFLLDDNNGDGLVTSINGKWGEGKTSLANLVKTQIYRRAKQSKIIPIVVNFSPWNVINDNQIINQFFQTLSSYFIYNKVTRFIKNVLQITDVIVKLAVQDKIIKNFFSELSKSFTSYYNSIKIDGKNVEDDKTKVETKLKKSFFRYIVFIDDLDRLNDKEIRVVIQLIKAICNFSNITYVLMIDKDIVAESLKKEQSFVTGYQYLKKIIQIEFNVPKIKHQTILTILGEDLDLVVPRYRFDKTRFEIAMSYGLFDQIDTIREEKRLMNNFKVVLNSFNDEIDFIDLLAITYLRTVDERCFKTILDYQDFLLANRDGFYSNKQERRDALTKLKTDFYDTLLKTTLLNEKSCELFTYLFPDQFTSSKATQNESFMVGRLFVPQKFHRYLELQEDYDDISLEQLGNISALNDSKSLINFANKLNPGKTKTFLEIINNCAYTVENESKAKVILEFLFNDISSLEVEQPLGIVDKSLYIRSICRNILKNITNGETLIVETLLKSNDTYAVVNFYYKLIDKEGDREFTNFSEENKNNICDKAKSLTLETLNKNIESIKYGGGLLTHFLFEYENEKIVELINSKDEKWKILFLDINYDVRNSYSSLGVRSYYFSYTNVLEKLLKVDFIDIESLINKSLDNRTKQRLIVYKMQFLDKIEPEDKRINAYSSKEIQKYCNSRNINFNASDAYERN